MTYSPDKNKKCTFVKMGTKVIPKRNPKDPKKWEEIVKDRLRRLKEFKSWF